MADFAPLVSAQYNDKTNGTFVHGVYWGGELQVAYGKLTFTAAGFGTGKAKLAVLPPGRKLIVPDLSRIVCPVGTATADLHVGLGAYTRASDGVAVAADETAFMDNGDVGGGAIDSAFVKPAGALLEVDSKEPVDVIAMIDTANSPAAGDLEVLVAYALLK